MQMLDRSLIGIQRRQRLWAVLHDGRGRAGKAFHIGLSLIIILSVALVPLEWVEGFSQYRHIVLIVEAIVVGLFTADYLLRIYAAPRRMRYILSWGGIVDLLSIVPFYAGIFGTEYIRVLRLVRFLKLAAVQPTATADEGASLRSGIGLLPNERIEHIVTKHPLILVLGCIPPVLAVICAAGTFLFIEHISGIALGVALILFGLVFFWRAWLDYSYDAIYVTDKRLIFQNQFLLGRSVNQVGYGSITNVKPQYAGILSYIFRYGTLVVDTAAEHPGQIEMRMVRRHEAAAHAIMRQASVRGAMGGGAETMLG